MNKTQIQALLKANDVPFANDATVPTLKQLALDNDISLTSETPELGSESVERRPAPSPAIKHGVDFIVKGTQLSNVKLMYVPKKDDITSKGHYKTESARLKHPDGFNGYLFKKGDTEMAFIADRVADAKFIESFANEDIHSFVLTSNVTGKTLPATQYDESCPEVFYELNTVITQKARAYHRKDAFEDFVFNPETFISNPELLSKSGLLDKILEESI